jgi:hypothetical protein
MILLYDMLSEKITLSDIVFLFLKALHTNRIKKNLFEIQKGCQKKIVYCYLLTSKF